MTEKFCSLQSSYAAKDFTVLETACDGRENVLFLTDVFSKYTQAVPTKDQRASTVTDWIELRSVPGGRKQEGLHPPLENLESGEELGDDEEDELQVPGVLVFEKARSGEESSEEARQGVPEVEVEVGPNLNEEPDVETAPKVGEFRKSNRSTAGQHSNPY